MLQLGDPFNAINTAARPPDCPLIALKAKFAPDKPALCLYSIEQIWSEIRTSSARKMVRVHQINARNPQSVERSALRHMWLGMYTYGAITIAPYPSRVTCVVRHGADGRGCDEWAHAENPVGWR